MDQELLAHIGFSYFSGIGPLHYKSLLTTFGCAAKAYWSGSSELEPIIGQSLTKHFIRYRGQTNLTVLYTNMKKQGISVLSQNTSRFPDSLRCLADAPICLYVKGDCELLQARLFAIVGTRNPTAYGTQLARHFASGLTEHGFIIVSGMALGIDAHAHWGALDAKGKTVAVLGCGVDIIYPPSHRMLYDRILATGGAIMSEFPPGHTVRRGLFVVRNRLISGLSQGLLVIEGTDKSGTLTTAKYAADQGKPVFAPPAPITSYASQAPNLLLKQGAVLVTDMSDILHEFGMKKIKKVDYRNAGLSEEEKRIVGMLAREHCTFDDMVLTLQLPPHSISTTLSRLELLNIITKDDMGGYHLHLG